MQLLQHDLDEYGTFECEDSVIRYYAERCRRKQKGRILPHGVKQLIGFACVLRTITMTR